MKSVTGAELMRRKFKILKWGKPWQDAFGKVEDTAVIFVWGNSGNGKTNFVLQLVAELVKHEKAAYNSLEEGDKMTMQQQLRNAAFGSLELRRTFFSNEPMEEFNNRMLSTRAPRILVIDSVQMTGWTFKTYRDFKKAHADKLIIIVSQADKGQPIGNLAVRIKLDADQKIKIEGYRAISNGRNNPGGIYTIWELGAVNYWGTQKQAS